MSRHLPEKLPEMLLPSKVAVESLENRLLDLAGAIADEKIPPRLLKLAAELEGKVAAKRQRNNPH
jgi:hypothetical protein